MAKKYEGLSVEELWSLIKEEWETTDATYKQLEKEFGIRATTIRSRRSREEWVRQEKVIGRDGIERDKAIRRKTKVREEIHHGNAGNIIVKIPNPTAIPEEEIRVSRREVDLEELDDELTEQERLFCAHYMRYFNATKAYLKVYGGTRENAYSKSARIMKRPRIIAQLDYLKKEQIVALKLDARDILQQYIDIAFADITDYTRFGVIEEPVLDKKGNPTGKVIRKPYMEFIDHEGIDGMVVSEVRLGKDGMGIKLHDKMKALERLEKYFNFLDETTQQKLLLEKMRLENKVLEQDAGDAGEGGGKTIILSGEDQMRAYIAEQKKKQGK